MLCASSSAFATAVTVPDDYSSVQEAIDSGADTVQIRPGSYPERLSIDHPVSLQGIDGGRPQLNALDISNLNFSSGTRTLSVSQLHFLGRVTHTTRAVHPRLLRFEFTQCTLDSGFFQILSIDPNDVELLSFHNSHLKGRSEARATGFIMEADTVDGQVSWATDGEVSIRDCWFRGGSGKAIQLLYMPGGTLARNRIEHYETGVSGQDMRVLTLEENVIVGCGTGMRLSSGDFVHVNNNEIRDCGVGIFVGPGDSVYIRRNRILRASTIGIRGGSVGFGTCQRL